MAHPKKSYGTSLQLRFGHAPPMLSHHNLHLADGRSCTAHLVALALNSGNRDEDVTALRGIDVDREVNEVRFSQNWA